MISKSLRRRTRNLKLTITGILNHFALVPLPDNPNQDKPGISSNCVSQDHFADAPCISNTIWEYVRTLYTRYLPAWLLPGSKISNLNVCASNISNFAYMHTWDVNPIFHEYQRCHTLTTHRPNFTVHKESQAHYRFLKFFGTWLRGISNSLLIRQRSPTY